MQTHTHTHTHTHARTHTQTESFYAHRHAYTHIYASHSQSTPAATHVRDIWTTTARVYTLYTCTFICMCTKVQEHTYCSTCHKSTYICMHVCTCMRSPVAAPPGSQLSSSPGTQSTQNFAGLMICIEDGRSRRER